MEMMSWEHALDKCVDGGEEERRVGKNITQILGEEGGGEKVRSGGEEKKCKRRNAAIVKREEFGGGMKM